jgi:alpha-amylase
MQRAVLNFFAFVFCLILTAQIAGTARGQAGFDDDRVMLQGFYWESYRHGRPEFPVFGNKRWYRIVEEQADTIRNGRFDLVWLPPPSFAGDRPTAGYDPREYFNLNNSYGSVDEHRSMLGALLNKGIEPVADIVINHRNGSEGWTGFKNPNWGTWAITRDDEAFTDPASEAVNTPLQRRGAAEEQPVPYGGHPGTTYAYGSFRDIDHTSERVRRDLIRYLLQLKSAGYRGWRYDMVHGYHARWIAVYNKASSPTFSVGEYDWDKHDAQRGWIWHSATSAGDLKTASSVFDFTTAFNLKDNKGNYRAWYGRGLGMGMVADNTDGHAWKNKSVTFIQNHDLGFRTKEDGSPEKDHESDLFANNWEVEQAYAQILTHPGVPSVFWKHYFDWGDDLRNKLRALINARKVAGVHAGSTVHLQSNAQSQGIYAARVVGRNGDLYVRVGGDDQRWEPSHSSYQNYREYAQGQGWKVWVGLPNNPDVQQAPLKAALPVPSYREPNTIEVPDSLLN